MTEIAKAFWEKSLTRLPQEELPALREKLENGEAARGLRLRPGVQIETVKAALPDEYAPVPWARDAFYLRADSRAGAHALHAAGAYYLQEPSAMAAVSALDARPGQRVLDLCAAPGGKSTQIAALLGGEGLLVSNEIVASRAKILSQNIERLGVRNAVVLCEAPPRLEKRFEGFFDRVLVDAPCSGEGMFRREEAARAEWTEESPAGCAARQREVLESAAKMLRPGGVLVYSTCTFNETENENTVSAFLQAHPEFAPEAFALPGVGKAENGCLRLWPHRLRGEGHFVARLRKADAVRNEDTGRVLPAPRRPLSILPPLSELLPGFDVALSAPMVRAGDTLWAVPEGMPDLSGLRALRTGLCLGELRGAQFFPGHALALALAPGETARRVALAGDEAAAYLRGEELSAPEGLGKGWLLATYRGLALGWVKCAGGMLKNHLPKGLRRAYEV